LQDLKGSRKYDFAGRIVEVEKRFTKQAGKPFAIITFEEFTGQAEVMVWNEVFEKFTDLLEVGRVIVLTAKVELDSISDSKRLTAERIRILEKPVAEGEPVRQADSSPGQHQVNGSSAGHAGVAALTLRLRSGEHTSDDLCKIRLIVAEHCGDTPLHLRVTGNNGQGVHLVASEKFKVKDSESLRGQLASWLDH
jgi:DNA polymerase-3 subunit alpha